MPVGTQATVKGLPPEAVRATGADIVLANTYHLMLRPGAERIARARRTAYVHELAAPDPHRFRRLPGHVALAAAQDHGQRRHLPLPPRRRDGRALAGTRDRDPDAARLRHRHAARRMRASCRRRAASSNAPCGCRCAWAERSKRAFEQRAAGTGAVRHRAGRRRPAICASRARALWSISAFPAMPSAAWPSASRRR